MQDRFLRGRQIAYVIYEYFRDTGAHEAVLDHTELFSISLQGDDIQDFDARWDQALLSTTEMPKGSILESLYKMRTRESAQSNSIGNVRTGHPSRSVETELSEVKKMVRRYMDQMIRTRKFKVRNERVETVVLIKTRNVKDVSVERQTGECGQLEKRDSVQKEMLAVSATTTSRREKRTQPSSLAPRPQTQDDGRRPSKGSAPRGT